MYIYLKVKSSGTRAVKMAIVTPMPKGTGFSMMKVFSEYKQIPKENEQSLIFFIAFVILEMSLKNKIKQPMVLSE